MKYFASVLVAGMVSFSAVGQQATELEEPKTELEAERGIFKEYTLSNFDDGGKVSHYVFRNFPAFYRNATIARTGETRALPSNLRSDVASFQIIAESQEFALNDYVTDSKLIDGMVILHGGSVDYENYPNQNAYDRHLMWSVTKVMVSAALASLQDQGRVNMDAAVEQYVPVLAGTAWEGTSVQDVANMASGMDCRDSEGYQNTSSCIYRYEETLGVTARKNRFMPNEIFMKRIKRRGTAGELYEYTSANTHILGWVIENITEQPLWRAMQDLVWDKVGAEADAMLMVSHEGFAYASGGVSARLRDVARFGMLYTDLSFGAISPAHIADMKDGDTIAFKAEQRVGFGRMFPADTPTHAAWQWDMIWPDGDAYKGGYSGQGLYVSPSRNLVIAFTGTNSLEGESHDLLPVSRQLAKSGLFGTQ